MKLFNVIKRRKSLIFFLMVMVSLSFATISCKSCEATNSCSDDDSTASSTTASSTTAPGKATITATAGDAQIAIAWDTVSDAARYDLYYGTTDGSTIRTQRRFSQL